MGGWTKSLAPSFKRFFSHVTSTNEGNSHQKFLTFSFNAYATMVSNFKVIPSPSPQIIEPETRPPFKKVLYSGQIIITLRV